MAEVTDMENNEGIRAATSAFSKGKDQTLNNTNVLNASGNITYVECSTQITQAIVDALLNGFVSNSRLSGMPLSAPISNENSKDREEEELVGNSNASKTSSHTVEDTSSVEPESEVDLEEGSSVSESNSSVNMIASYEPLFIPEETLSRLPSGQEVYVQKLFPLQYGFPLWFPQPARNLPLEYRRKGISAGDVGVITSTGNFHFLFNISLPAGHPINPNDLPDDFVYLSEDKLRSESHDSFNPGHSAVSNLDIISDQDENTNDIVITCKDGNKGAILSIPDGASDEDLVNEWDLKEFISKNALTWYRYARQCGLELNHRSLYLVTGHMKSKSWGIATFNKAVPERNAVLKMAKMNAANGLPFCWKKSGGANVSRTGPSPDPGVTSENPSQIENQCLFLRGFQISLSKAMWTKMWTTDSNSVPDEDSPDKHPEPPINRDGVKKSNHEQGTGSDGQSSTDKYNGNNIGLSRFPERNFISHPLSVINDILLSMVPNAHIAVTHERSLFQFISTKYVSGRSELHEIVRSQFVIRYCEKTGMRTIEPRKNISPHLIRGRSGDNVDTTNQLPIPTIASKYRNITGSVTQDTQPANGIAQYTHYLPLHYELGSNYQVPHELVPSNYFTFKYRTPDNPPGSYSPAFLQDPFDSIYTNPSSSELTYLGEDSIPKEYPGHKRTSSFSTIPGLPSFDWSGYPAAEASMSSNINPAAASTSFCPYPSPNASPRLEYNDLPSPSPDDQWNENLIPRDVSRPLDTTGRVANANQKRRKQEATFTCPIPGCGSTFTRSFRLKGHMRSHNEEKPFQCHWPGCGKGFARERDYKRHELLHARYTPDASFTCDGCQKQFARMEALNMHLRSEEGSECAKMQEQSVPGYTTTASSSGAQTSMELTS